MGVFFLFWYLVLTVLAPAELFPALAPYRLAFWSGMIGLLFSAGAVLKGAGFSRLPQSWALIGFVAVACVSRVFNDRYLYSSVEVVSKFGVSLIMFLLVLWSVNSFKRMRWLAFAIVISLLLLCVQGLYSLATGWDSWRVQYMYADEHAGQERVENSDEFIDALEAIQKAGGDPQAISDLKGMAKAAAISDGKISTRVRGNGVMQDPNDFAMGLITALPFCWLALRKGKRLRNLLLVWLPTALILITVYYTRSRGGVLSLMAVVGTLAYRRIGRTKTILVIVLFVMAAAALNVSGGRSISTDDESAEGRINAWSEGFQMLRSNPLLGVGFEQFTDYNQLTAHNSYVLCFAEEGVAGYFFWILILVASLFQVSALMRVSGPPELAQRVQRWAWALQLSFVGFLVAAFFLSRSYVYIFYLFAAMICALTLIAQQAGLELKLPALGRIVKTTIATESATLVGIYLIVRVNQLFV